MGWDFRCGCAFRCYLLTCAYRKFGTSPCHQTGDACTASRKKWIWRRVETRERRAQMTEAFVNVHLDVCPPLVDRRLADAGTRWPSICSCGRNLRRRPGNSTQFFGSHGRHPSIPSTGPVAGRADSSSVKEPMPPTPKLIAFGKTSTKTL